MKSQNWLNLAAMSVMFTSILFGVSPSTQAAEPDLDMKLRVRVEEKGLPGQFALIERAETWKPSETAVIVCDMWDLHHCLNAVKRGSELAPIMNEVLKNLRIHRATIIHAPSECMDAYKDHAARQRAINTPKAKNFPAEIGAWCYKIPSEEKGVYPIDQTDGGEDDDAAEHAAWAKKLGEMGRNPKAPWKSQTEALTIDTDKDLITAVGEEVWSILEERKIKNVILMGVHLNMCVLGRPFGLRQMAKNGRNVVLMRDMTDTMYNPAMSPKVNHFAGTDLMVEHVEKYVCPTITSDQVIGGKPFVFQGDKRPHAVFIIGEDEYRTECSLPAFASKELTNEFRVSYILGDANDRNALTSMTALSSADVAVISVRRRVLPNNQLMKIRKYVESGKPIVGIRTASHAFSPRGNDSVPVNHESWPEFDSAVLGGHYTGHHGAANAVVVKVATGAESHPILNGVDVAKIVGHGSLYKVSPLAKTTQPLLMGTIPAKDQEPVAWTNETLSHGRTFYTSLGQIDDFASREFCTLFHNAIRWVLR